VSSIKRDKTGAYPRSCDKFLYGFKGAPPARHPDGPGPVNSEDGREQLREKSGQGDPP
jgi:hypothetical protein